ncbi:hypothetical protein K2X33_02695, partial [bacterium]|nr:hypothetical protein [bacterium]
EGEYNLDLAAFFRKVGGGGAAYTPAPLKLPVQPMAREQAATAIARVGGSLDESFWIAHPGMGGSALNLSIDSYVRLLDDLEKKIPGPLYLTMGPAPRDLQWVEGVVDQRPHWRVFPRVGITALAEVYRAARLVVAPSTGPLHLAHYVGTKTLGIFSPVRSQQASRWAPWGGAGESLILAPEHPCPGKRDCLGTRCPRYFCLDKLTLSPGLLASV